MKAWKLQECVAHSPGSVTCLSLGRKSGRVLVTGGEDRRVKLWAVGKPTCILSLTGHTSSVEAAEFSKEEDRVAAGSLSGSIRIWDLEEVKVIRALSGHTSAINTLDFHPFGNFVVSGSMDTLVKLWDVSRKGCINTYRGHSGGIHMLRFSPDGKWVASAAEDGVVKLWDLSAGRQLAELSGHTGPVTAVAFHPNYLLLATASADRTVRIFSLENFSQVAVSGLELAATAVRQIAFHPNGSCLYVATSDYLRIYDYEAMSCLETVHVGWRVAGGLDDMAVAPSFNQLVGVSISNSLVSTYVVDVRSCQPFTDGDSESAAVSLSAQPDSLGDDDDGNPHREMPSAGLEGAPRPAACSSRALGSVVGAQSSNVVAQQRPFTRCGSSHDSVRNRKSFCLQSDASVKDTILQGACEPESGLEDQQVEQTAAFDINDPEEYARVFQPHRSLRHSPSICRRAVETSSTANAVPTSSCRGTPSRAAVSPAEAVGAPPPRPGYQWVGDSEKPFTPPLRSQAGRGVGRSAVVGCGQSSLVTAGESLDVPGGPSSSVIAPAEKGSFTEADDVDLPAISQPVRETSLVVVSEAEWLSRLRKPHQPFMSVLSARLKNLASLRVMWTCENAVTAVESALMIKEPAVLVDLLTILTQNNKYWNLDLVIMLLPHLDTLVRSKYSTHVTMTCQTVSVILKNFSSLIRQTLEGPPPTGVDLMREERMNKCHQCMKHLSSIRSALDVKDVASRAGQPGRELLVLFQLLT